MRITLEINEESLIPEIVKLVEYCKVILSDYKKKKDVEIPVISVRMPNAKVKEVKPHTEFINELLKMHLDRVPTANVPAQRSALKGIYEAGFTDKEELIKMYNENLKTFASTSWFTVRWKLNHAGQKEAQTEETDMAFVRKDLDEAEQKNLTERIKNSKTTLDR